MGVVFAYGSFIVWGFIVPCLVLLVFFVILKAIVGLAASNASENDRLFYSEEGRQRRAEIDVEAETYRRKVMEIEARRTWTEEDWEAYRIREKREAAAKTEEIRKIAQLIAQVKETSLYL